MLALHDLGHRIVAYFMKVDSEFQFWGLGTITLLLTSWLFGLAFAQPGRFLLEKEGAQPKKLALITLAGPAISWRLRSRSCRWCSSGASQRRLAYSGSP